MRSEKKYLVQEINKHLDKGSFVFLADFRGLTVSEAADLRTQLAKQEAEFHVVKNAIFGVALKSRELPDVSDMLAGQTGIVVGGKNASEVAKILVGFGKEKNKLAPKGGLIDAKRISAADLDALSKLPSLEVLRAQLLGLLNTPATQVVRVLNAVPQGMLNVLDAKTRKDGNAA